MTKIIFITSLIAFSVIACNSNEPEAGAAGNDSKAHTNAAGTPANENIVELTQEQFTRAGITTGVPVTGAVSGTIKVNGVVEAPPENLHTISFPLGGYLKSSSLIPGMQVKKGGLLATLEDASFIQLQQDYLLSKSKLTFLEADYQRQQELNKTQSNSQRTFQQAKTDLENEQITRSALAEKLRLIGISPETLTEKNLSRTVNIYSPISGYVSKVNANPGKYVAPTDVLFEIINLSGIHISLTVFESDAAALKIGQEIEYTSSHGGGIKGTATIELISPSINESRAVEVHCHINPPLPRLLPGSFVNAEIKLVNRPAPTLPNEAIVTWQNKHFLFTEDAPLTFQLIPVTIGESSNGYTAIKSAIPTDKKIVTANAYALLTILKNTPEE